MIRDGRRIEGDAVRRFFWGLAKITSFVFVVISVLLMVSAWDEGRLGMAILWALFAAASLAFGGHAYNRFSDLREAHKRKQMEVGAVWKGNQGRSTKTR
jgi:drug/metabolite transporter (DMT)-like permease